MMEIVPITLKEANDFVESFHRHNKRTAWDGGKYAVGLETDELAGVAIVGLPLARSLHDGRTAEVLRCCVSEDAPKNACSKLYAACWRAWRAMGGLKMITYTLQAESGASLRGAGFRVIAECKPRTGGWNSTARKREWQPIYGQLKFRWEKST